MSEHTVHSIKTMSFLEARRALAEAPELRDEFFDAKQQDEDISMAKTVLEQAEDDTRRFP